MDAQEKPPQTRIIVRHSSCGEEEGHHGGAWKVAYADFVTAMMAFFLLMWLLNATTEQQRSGLAEYFNPSVTRTPGASGDGVDPGIRVGVEPDQPDSNMNAPYEAVARQVQDRLNGLGAESMQMRNVLKHVVTRMTDEGLVIELNDLTDEPLYVADSAEPTPMLVDLATILAGALKGMRNDIAISGHVRSYPEALVESPVWTLSNDRAHAFRAQLDRAGFDDQRVQRVTGFADRKNFSANPMDARNNRIEVILLR